MHNCKSNLNNNYSNKNENKIFDEGISHGIMSSCFYGSICQRLLFGTIRGTGNGMTIDKPFGDPIKAFAALEAQVMSFM